MQNILTYLQYPAVSAALGAAGWSLICVLFRWLVSRRRAESVSFEDGSPVITLRNKKRYVYEADGSGKDTKGLWFDVDTGKQVSISYWRGDEFEPGCYRSNGMCRKLDGILRRSRWTWLDD